MRPPCLISVVIATYNRASILGECLTSLTTQSSMDFEVIVVDNNSTDNTEQIVASFTCDLPHLQMVKSIDQGAGFARNFGIDVARGKWIACLDSDARAHNNWIEVILREIDRDNFDCFGGPYLAWHHYGPPPNWFSAQWENNCSLFTSYGLLPDNIYPTSGSCAFKRDLVIKLGGFPTDIGMKGERCAYGEETKLFRLMRKSGARLGGVPDMQIDHCVLPYKYTLRWRLNSFFARGRDMPMAFGTPLTLKALFGQGRSLLRAFLALPTLVWRGVNEGHAWQRILLDSVCTVLVPIGGVFAIIQQLLVRFLSR